MKCLIAAVVLTLAYACVANAQYPSAVPQSGCTGGTPQSYGGYQPVQFPGYGQQSFGIPPQFGGGYGGGYFDPSQQSFSIPPQFGGGYGFPSQQSFGFPSPYGGYGVPQSPFGFAPQRPYGFPRPQIEIDLQFGRRPFVTEGRYICGPGGCFRVR
jgi:hypothetical protein